ncbi:1-acyl-sn-glycerol-3-phosphate acyltransferase [Candidatus Parcubacteria bacterium]|nr:1-acyl-sn-glycerol-3-phosphate acyltransferase [Candidatus Parcubacteria bacterium]
MIFAFFQFFTWLISNFIGKVFLNLRVKGKENLKSLKSGGVLFVANHPGKFDPFFVGAALPRSHYRRIKCFRYLTYYKYIKCKWYGFFIWLSGAYPVYKDQGNFEKSLGRTTKLLRDNQNVLMFPTSKIQKDFVPSDARPGVAWLAKKINPRLVPVYVNRKDIRHVVITFGKPFVINEVKGGATDNREVAARIMKKVSELKKDKKS